MLKRAGLMLAMVALTIALAWTLTHRPGPRASLAAEEAAVAPAVKAPDKPAKVEPAAAEKTVTPPEQQELAKLADAEPLSKVFRLVAQKTRPAVVEVRVRKRVAAPQFPFGDLDGFFRRYRGGEPDEDQPAPAPGPRRRAPAPAPAPRGGDRGDGRERYFMQQGLGSGVIVDAKNGYILTNQHVVGGADEVEVVLHDGRKYATKWVRGDWQSDLAVIKIDGQGLTAAPVGDSDKMEVGDWVLAIGAPEGLTQTVTQGIVSAKGRTTGGRPYENFIQTDAAINQGNSGGPLVNLRGEVIGINAAIVSRTGAYEGIGFAIPSSMASYIMRQLIDGGKVVRGYLGVGIQDVDEELARSFKLPETKGALVTKVVEDSPAAKAGIQEEDFIVAVNGRKLADKDDLRNYVATLDPGKKCDVTLFRKGEKKAVSVTIGAQPAEMTMSPGEKPAEPEAREKFGLEVQTLTPELAKQSGHPEKAEGVLVTGVEQGSDAAEKGLRQGMVIDQVGAKKVATAQQFAAEAGKLEKGQSLRLRVTTRDGSRQYMVISPK